MTLPGTYAPASIALRPVEALKPRGGSHVFISHYFALLEIMLERKETGIIVEVNEARKKMSKEEEKWREN
jgi:hypothetical protein